MQIFQQQAKYFFNAESSSWHLTLTFNGPLLWE